VKEALASLFMLTAYAEEAVATPSDLPQEAEAAPAEPETEAASTAEEDKTVTLKNVKWKLDEAFSSRTAFSSEKAGDVFVYVPVIPSKYEVEAELPRITVTIAEKKLNYPAFQQTKRLNGIAITVTAEEGVFPEGAVLSADLVPASQTADVDEAIEKEREDGRNVAVSYTFDIKVLDKDGNELQPEDGNKVHVSFAAAEVVDENLEVSVYHISDEQHADESDPDENDPAEKHEEDQDRNEAETPEEEPVLSAEKLEIEIDKETQTVTAETDGFSLYTVEFTYNDLQYVLSGGEKEKLSAILETVHLSGSVQDVQVSDPALFTAGIENGEWVVTSLKPFSSEEWMKVTINGIVYTITVTDVNVSSWAALQTAFTNGQNVTLTSDITASSADERLSIPAGVDITLDLNGHTINRNLTEQTSNGHVISLSGKLTIKDGSSAKTGNITGGFNNSTPGGCIVVFSGGELIMQSGKISENSAEMSNNAGQGGGVAVKSGATFTMTGGTIDSNRAPIGGGVWVDEGATFTMSNNAKITNNVGGVNHVVNSEGGGVAVYGTFTMEGGTISGNTAGTSAGGVFVSGYSGHTPVFTMNGGTISGNTSYYDGGGVCLRAPDGTVNINGGSIVNNKCGSVGGAVNISQGTFNLKGSIDISGNKCGSDDSNIYGGPINIVGTLSNTNAIGVTTRTVPTEANCVYFTHGLTGNGTYTKFKSDSDKYYMGECEVSAGVKEAALYAKYKVSVKCSSYNRRFTPESYEEYVIPGSAMTTTEITANSGYGFPADYTLSSANGISVARTSQTKLTISGTPTTSTELTIDPASRLYTVSINAGAHMTKTGSSGAASQTVATGESITAVVYQAASGYQFTDSYKLPSKYGISTARNSSTKITISGTPTYDTTIDLGAATAIPATAPTVSGPSDVTMTYGDTGKKVSVTATPASGHTITNYEWRRNVTGATSGGTLVTSGASASSYTIPATQTAGTYYYYCRVTTTRTDNSQTATKVSGVAKVTINKANLTITAEAKSKTYGAADPALTYVTSGLKGSDAMSGSLSRVSGENVGSYKINQGTVTVSNSGNYNITYVSANLTINKATLTVTAEAKSKTYGDADPALTYTASGFKRTDTKESVMTGALTRAAGEDYGTYAISQGTVSAGNNYTISYTGADLTIGKATLTVTAEAKSKTYGDADPALTYTVAGFKNGDTKESVMSGSLTRAAGEDYGTYAISQGTVTAGDNYTISYTGADLTINKATLTVTAEAKSKTYGDADPALTYTASGFKNGDTQSVMSGVLHRAAGEIVGAYAIDQGTVTAGDNYTISYTGANLTINAAPLTVTAEAKTKTYGDADPELTYTATGFKNGDTQSVMSGSLTRAAGEDVGDYAIGQGSVTAGDNYTISYTGADLSIGAAPLTVTAEAKTKTYGDADPELTYTATGFKRTDTKESVMTGALERAAGEDVGDYAIGQGTVDAGANYTINYTGANLTIGTAPLTVTADAVSKTYGDADPELTYTATGFKRNDTKESVMNGGLIRDDGEDVGDYAVSQGKLGAGNNYTIAFTGAQLSITKAPLSITTESAEKVYDGTALTAGGNLAGLVGGETATINVTGSQTDVGAGINTYSLSWDGTAKETNYELASETLGELTVTPAPLSITTESAEKVYDGTALTAGGSIDGLIGGETATVNGTGTQTAAGSSENTYSLVFNGTAKEANYAVVSGTLGTLRVTPKEVTVSGITAKNKYFDRNTDAVLVCDAAVFDGLIDGDELMVSGVGTFEDNSVGFRKTVYISELRLGGADAGNYRLAASGNQETATADIIMTKFVTGGGSGAPFTGRKGYVADSGGTWVQEGADWSYTLPNGQKAVGWNYLSYNGRSDWYYFAADGRMQWGWLTWEGHRYYLNPVSDGWKGAMYTGWHLIGGRWYYFEPVAGQNQGHLYVNGETPDGYQVGADGARIG